MNTLMFLTRIFDSPAKNLSLSRKERRRKRKGFSLVEILVACSIIISLSVTAFFGYQHAQQTRKMAQVYNDLTAIRTAAIVYEAMSSDGSVASTLDDLIAGLDSTETIDGSDKTNLLQSGKGGDTVSIVDPWGTEYVYSSTDRSVSCTPYDTDGTTQLDTITFYF